MSNLHYRLNLDVGKTCEIFYHSSKEHPKVSKMTRLAVECCKIRKTCSSWVDQNHMVNRPLTVIKKMAGAQFIKKPCGSK